jgi:hypothetical protein
MDRDASAIRAMPSAIGRVTIRIHVGDFTVPPWPFTSLDGVLLANSLHYIPEPVGFVRHAAASMGHPRFVVVEYDTDNSNRWIPYPLSRKSLTRVFNEVGLTSPRLLGTRRSALRRGLLYAVAIV